MTIYLLELMINTPTQFICEPLGVYKTMRKAKKFENLVKKRFPSSKTIMTEVGVMPMEIDQPPPILDVEIEPTSGMGKELMYLYDNNILDQVVEPDGTFSYVLTPKFKKLLEDNISRKNV